MDQRDLFQRGARSLAVRALVAIVLMLGFYVLALGISGFLLFLPYAEVRYVHHIHPKLALLCIAGAGLILWSIVPRPERFTAPGPRLLRSAQPKLFEVIEQVARATRQPPPAEVYLLPDMNAWVSSRGGVVGFGSRRIMGIGLPLLEQLTVSELHGVLAHEFGHYYGGDVKLGPWIYKTRSAIWRTVEALARAGSGLVHKPFIWYGALFLRLTHAISRNQELQADALAAQVVGRDAFVSGMRAVHAGAHAFQSYWRAEVAPVLSAGYRPPLAHGYARYLASAACNRLAAFTSETIEQEQADPYDTHPPTRERIARVSAMALALPLLTADTRPSRELLQNLDELEHALVNAVAPDPDSAAKLRPITWDRVAEAVWLSGWRSSTERSREVLAKLTPAAVPTEASELRALGKELIGRRASELPEEVWSAHAAGVVAAATACLLVERGWGLEALPGDQVVFRSGGVELKPFVVLSELAAGKGDGGAWLMLHGSAQISDVPLATARAAQA